MTNLPLTDRPLLVRTNFSDDSAWQSATSAVMSPGPEMMQAFDFIKLANSHLQDPGEFGISALSVETLEDAQHKEATPEELLKT